MEEELKVMRFNAEQLPPDLRLLGVQVASTPTGAGEYFKYGEPLCVAVCKEQPRVGQAEDNAALAACPSPASAIPCPGTHHTKAMLLEFEAGMRLIITSGPIGGQSAARQFLRVRPAGL